MMLKSMPISALAEVRSGGGAPQDSSAFTATGHPFVRAGSLPKLLDGASESTGWSVRNGSEIAPGEPAADRDDYGQVVLAQRLRDALARLNPALPAEALEDASAS